MLQYFRPHYKNYLSIVILALISLCAITLFSSSSYAGDTYYTDDDNEDNDLTGNPDGDLDQLLSSSGWPQYPIEFNINVSGALPLESAQLVISAHDVDEEFGEIDAVSLNGNLVGNLSGTGDEDSSTVFNVPTNLIVAGNNLVEITINSPWALTVHWGQLLIDGGAANDAIITRAEISSYDETAGTVTIEIDTTIDINNGGNYRLELNLKDENGNTIDITTDDFVGTAGETRTQTYSTTYPNSSDSGTFQLEALLFFEDSGFNVQQDYAKTSFSHTSNSGPQTLPGDSQNSSISISASQLTADGSSTATITLQAVDFEGSNTSLSGQTVSFASNLGSIGSVTDNNDGTYSATITSPTQTGPATVTASIDGNALLDTESISFIPGAASGSTSLIGSDLATLPANGSATSNITIQLYDANNNPLTSGGDVVNLATTSGSFGSVTDNNNGSYSVTLTSSTNVGSATISGLVNGNPITDTETVTYTVLPASMSETLISSTPNSIIANGLATSTILIQAINELGTPLTTGGSTLDLATTLGTLGTVSDLNNGYYSATLTAGTNAGIAIVSGLFDGSAIIDNEMVSFTAGPADPLTSTISASHSSLTADGMSTTTITLQARDTNSNISNSGGANVSFATSAGSLGSVNDLGDGRYTTTLTAPTTASTAIVSGTMNNVSVPDTATVQFAPGAANAAQTTIGSTESSLTADGSSTTTITVTTRDQFGNSLTSGGNTVTLNASTGTLSTIQDNGDGTYTVQYTTPTNSGTASISGSINGSPLSNTSIQLNPGPADLSNSTINASLPQLVADGRTTSLLTVQAIDAHGNLLTRGGDNIELSTSLGSIDTLTDLGNGQYQATFTSGTSIGTARVTGTIGGFPINDSENISLMVRPTVHELASNTNQPSVSGVIPLLSGATIGVEVNGQDYSVGDGHLSVLGSHWTLNIPASHALSDGFYNVTISVTDSAAQVSSDNTDNELLIDTVIPTITIDPIAEADSTNILNYPITGTCTEFIDLISIQVTDETANSVSQQNISCDENGDTGNYSTTINLRALADGSITIFATIEDAAENTATARRSTSKTSCSPDNSVAFCDSDEDGITDGDEEDLGLNPENIDSDGDGLADSLELGADPNNPIDSDGDGTPDALDTDSDNDGIPDKNEYGGNSENPVDTDQDGVPDHLDPDSDNDMVPDSIEARFPDNDVDDDGIPNFQDRDSDNDGIPDSLENGLSKNLDSDNDGIDDAFDVDSSNGVDSNSDGIDDAIELVDTDGGARPDMFDTDSDNDGIPDSIESDLAAVNDSDSDGIPDNFDVDNTGGEDTNNDGVDDTSTLTDTDSDGIPDYRDLDSDNDGLSDVSESGGTDESPIDALADNGSSLVSPPRDSDGDAIPDHRDLESNDASNNGKGPFDIDALGNASLDSNTDGTIDSQRDSDGDGIVDLVDEDPTNFGSLTDFDLDGIANSIDLDDDNDGIPDSIEGDSSLDTDGDGQPDYIDLDSDNDGIPDIKEAQTSLIDADNNGRVDTLIDTDNNGLDDRIPVDFTPIDSDDDATPDYLDLDSDGDTIPDLNEANDTNMSASELDTDGDGRIDQTGVSGLTAHVFSLPIDTDADSIENYIDLDSDNDGFSDADENGDYNNNGINDSLETAETNLETAIQGGGGAMEFIMVLLIGLAMKLSKVQRPLLLTALIYLPLFSTSTHAQESHCATDWINPNISQYETELGFNKQAFQECWYAIMGMGASYLSPEGESNGWSRDDRRSSGIAVLFGRHFKENWALEIAYTYLGTAGLKNINSTVDSKIEAGIRYQSPSLLLVHRFLEESSPFNLYTKFGISWLKTEGTHKTVFYEKQTEAQMSFGVGIEYRMQQSPWFARLDLLSHAKDAQFGSFQIGRYFNHSPTRTKAKEIVYSHPANRILKQDSDGDKVPDDIDKCPHSFAGQKVNAFGCCTEEEGCFQIQ